ncbi:MAG: ribosome biogenesis GTPase Der [Verrucomicrobiaceae bacterium]|nr:ribosome biogenesis GTPase Der [Verrucomicrobiaceae bacterium]
MRKTVAIVGRPNVGKSALFNRLAGMNISIVHDMPGVTRDRITAECRRGPAIFDIMDTGGIGANTEDVLTDQVQVEAAIALEVADLLLFVVDVIDGITPIDQALASELRKTSKPVILVCNKADSPKRKLGGAEFSRLGFKEQVEVSAAHGLGISELVAAISKKLELFASSDASDKTEATRPLKIAIVGRPNAGKSSLVNQVLGKTRAIVSDVPGTTRDSLDIRCTVNGHEYILIDTAGIRRQAKIDAPVEIFSINRAIQSIKRADLCLLMVDCADGAKMQDRKIAQLILEQRKPCILVMNKYDLFHPTATRKDRVAALDETMSREFFFLHYAPLVAVSAKRGQHIDMLFKAVERVRRGAQTRIGTGALNRLLGRAIENSPTSVGSSAVSFKLLYATQVNSATDSAIPVPHFVLFFNRAAKLQESYLRHLEKIIREEWPGEGLPFVMSVRGKQPKADTRRGGSRQKRRGRDARSDDLSEG